MVGECVSDLFNGNESLMQVASGCKFTEGPAADLDGNLFFSDSPNNRIKVLGPNGQTDVWREPNGCANGMNFNREGRFVACCAQGEGGRRAVVRFNFAHELEIYRFRPYARNTDKLHVVWQDLKTLNITAISSVYHIACNQPRFLSYPRIQ
jgi:hypothetical protein